MEIIMKKYLLALTLISTSSLIISTAFAQSSGGDYERTVLNKVKIINDTPRDIGYIIISDSTNPDNVYGVRSKKSDTYHAKATGDMMATMKVGACKKINKATGICSEFKADSAKNCLRDARYDFYKVKSIKISSLDSCIITCNDGGRTSCAIK
jgi:hypothetical protein